MRRSVRRKSAKISDAVFRGRKGEYTFEVYPLAAEVPETPAVFILSRRKIHRTGHVSHAVSCIGETGSVQAEVKRHKRSKCVKHNETNVVCVLRDESEKSRALVLDDIAGARSFGCVRGVLDLTMLRKPQVLAVAKVKALPGQIIPSVPLPLKPVRRKRVEPVRVQEADEDKNTKPARKSPAGNGRSGGTKKRPASAAKPTKPVRSAKPAKPDKVVKPSRPARPAAPTVKTANAKGSGAERTKASAAKPKQAAAKPRTRVQGRVDSDRGQHRLPKPKRAAAGRAKTRTAKRVGTGKKAAA